MVLARVTTIETVPDGRPAPTFASLVEASIAAAHDGWVLVRTCAGSRVSCPTLAQLIAASLPLRSVQPGVLVVDLPVALPTSARSAAPAGLLGILATSAEPP